MSSYYLKCRKNTKDINPIVSKITNDKTILLSKRAIYDGKTPLSKVALLDNILF